MVPSNRAEAKHSEGASTAAASLRARECCSLQPRRLHAAASSSVQLAAVPRRSRALRSTDRRWACCIGWGGEAMGQSEQEVWACWECGVTQKGHWVMVQKCDRHSVSRKAPLQLALYFLRCDSACTCAPPVLLPGWWAPLGSAAVSLQALSIQHCVPACTCVPPF